MPIPEATQERGPLRLLMWEGESSGLTGVFSSAMLKPLQVQKGKDPGEGEGSSRKTGDQPPLRFLPHPDYFLGTRRSGTDSPSSR